MSDADEAIFDYGDITVQKPPSEIDVESLIAERRRKFRRKLEREHVIRNLQVTANSDKAVGLLFFGDPHVDDDGTDIDALFRHARIVRETDGMRAVDIGDRTNNWVGRLSRLYADQSTSAAEGLALAEHWICEVRDWLLLIGGNHDVWSGASDPFRFILRQTAVYEAHGARLRMSFPNGVQVTLDCKHQFHGHSQWNPTHAIGKAAQMGEPSDLMVSGHRHICGYSTLVGPRGDLSHCLQVGSYKIVDEYAKAKALREKHISPCAVAVIDPRAPLSSRVTVWWDPQAGAEYLTYLRNR